MEKNSGKKKFNLLFLKKIPFIYWMILIHGKYFDVDNLKTKSVGHNILN